MKSSSNRAMNAEILAKSLQQENDILRFQLNDLINREQNQVSLHNLDTHADFQSLKTFSQLEALTRDCSLSFVFQTRRDLSSKDCERIEKWK